MDVRCGGFHRLGSSAYERTVVRAGERGEQTTLPGVGPTNLALQTLQVVRLGRRVAQRPVAGSDMELIRVGVMAGHERAALFPLAQTCLDKQIEAPVLFLEEHRFDALAALLRKSHGIALDEISRDADLR